MLRILAIASALLCALTVHADARHRAKPVLACVSIFDLCTWQSNDRSAIEVTKHRASARRRPIGGQLADASVLPHPSGCPRRAFCGCGAAVRIFGAPIRSLWLAANWFRFPRATPAAGMVAVRRHHVFVLEQNISGDTWLVFDANSGRHRTQIHPRSIAGYRIVDPHGA